VVGTKNVYKFCFNLEGVYLCVMANQYDKIFKENLDPLIPHLLEVVLGIDVFGLKLETMKDKLQKTIEREADFFKRVVHEDSSRDYCIHIEIQAQDEDMRMRMLVYYALFYQKFGIPLKQIVIYVGKEPARLVKRNKVKIEGLGHQFMVIDLRSVPKAVFLQSNKPECVMLALLANFGKDKPENVIRQILENIGQLEKSKNALLKYQQQLMVLSRLRDLTETTAKVIETMDFHFEVEKDSLFIRGMEKGQEAGIEKGIDLGAEKAIKVAEMLMQGKHSLAEIIKATDVSKAFVERIAQKFGFKLPE
jgi:predicted transposase YdaD